MGKLAYVHLVLRGTATESLVVVQWTQSLGVAPPPRLGVYSHAELIAAVPAFADNQLSELDTDTPGSFSVEPEAVSFRVRFPGSASHQLRLPLA